MWKWTLVAAAVAIAGCGDGGAGPALGMGGSGGVGGTGEGRAGGEETVARDTSGYEGLLAWASDHVDEVFAVWDLANSQMVFEEVYPHGLHDRTYFKALNVHLSGDGSTLAYGLSVTQMGEPVNGVSVGSPVFGVKRHVLGSDVSVSWSDDAYIMSFANSISENGERVAAVVQEGLETRFEVWDALSGARTVIPGFVPGDSNPLINAAGTSLTYRATPSGAFHRFDMEEGVVAETFGIESDAIRWFPPVEARHGHDVSQSADGRWLVFFAETHERQIRPFLLDTTNGAIERIAEDALAVQLSGDGSRLVWLEATDEGEGAIYTRLRTESTPTLVGAPVFLNVPHHAPFAVSHDGSQIAFVEKDEGWNDVVVVVRPDGSDKRVVTDGEGRDLRIVSLTF